MIEIFHEAYVQILTLVFMVALIALAVFLGHKIRKIVDQKKSMKEKTETTQTEVTDSSVE